MISLHDQHEHRKYLTPAAFPNAVDESEVREVRTFCATLAARGRFVKNFLISENGYGMLLRMDKEAVKAKLLEYEPELKAAGIVHLHLHGSVVRGEAGPDSDVDLAAVFDRAKVRGILAEIGLKHRLSEILGADADLCNAERLKELVQGNFDREAELVF